MRVLLHFKIHYLKFVCKITCLNYSNFLCLFINLVINFKLIAGFDLFSF